MATIQSFPTPQVEDSSGPNPNTNSFPAYFGIKTHVNRMFAGYNKFQNIHMFVLLFCLHLLVWLPLISSTSIEMLQLSSIKMNKSLARDEMFERAFAKRCSLVPSSLLLSTPVENFNRYKSIRTLNNFLCIGCEIFMVVAQLIYHSVSPEQLKNPYRWFCWGRKVLIYLVASSICHQLASALTYRPMDILFNFRYTSMLLTQMTGFLTCILFAFFFGIKFASIKAIHRPLYINQINMH